MFTTLRIPAKRAARSWAGGFLGARNLAAQHILSFIAETFTSNEENPGDETGKIGTSLSTRNVERQELTACGIEKESIGLAAFHRHQENPPRVRPRHRQSRVGNNTSRASASI